MNREELLNWFLENPECWGVVPEVYDWTFQNGQYVHTLHDPITMDDWNRAKIVPRINARVLAEKVGNKHDTGKPLYNLIPVHAEAEFVDVLTFGATKYAPNQWRTVPNATGRYTAAAMRHLAAYRMGETHDIESGKHHLAHAMCCLAFIIELDLEQDK